MMKKAKEISRGITRREFLYLSGAGAAGIVVGGLPTAGHGEEKKPKYGGRMRVAERYACTGLDAHRNQFYMDFQNYTLMYNALTEMGELPQVRMYPSLAKSWEISPDGREYTFPLREGVKFHHGKELDSGDVKYSIERVMNPATRSPRAFAYRWIDSVNIIDKYHLKIRLKESFGPFLSTLTIQNCPIIPAGWEPTGMKPAPGTGPFVFKAFVPNETTDLTRFDKYWEVDEKTGDRLPYLDSIYIKKIVDETVRWTALRAGDLDYINCPPRNIVLDETKKQTPGMVTVMPQPVAYVAMIFNVAKPPFDNKKVRQAVAFGTNKKEFIQAAYWGLAEAVSNQPFSNRSRFYVPVKDREPDLAKAKQLLAEAGYPNGFKVEILTYSDTTYVDGAQAAVGQMKNIGIEATIKVIDRAPFWEYARKGQ
jgi:peptide/nickel transport system substrate-binding protein